MPGLPGSKVVWTRLPGRGQPATWCRPLERCQGHLPSCPQPCGARTGGPISQAGKRRPRKGKRLAQGHISNLDQSQLYSTLGWRTPLATHFLTRAGGAVKYQPGWLYLWTAPVFQSESDSSAVKWEDSPNIQQAELEVQTLASKKCVTLAKALPLSLSFELC